MPSNVYTDYVIPPLTEETPSTSEAAVDMLDSRFGKVTEYLNELSVRIGELNTKSAIIRQHVPLETGVTPGTLVYYNADAGHFAPAQALLLPASTEGGQTIEAPEARVEGLVLSTDSGSDPLTGTMLCGGYWESQEVADACLGENASPGIYYLSPSVAGTATKDTYGHLRQPVLSYYDAGKFNMNIFYMAHDNHFHASQVLDGTWKAADLIQSEDHITPPAGAQFGYVGAYAIGLGELGNTTAVFWNGELQRTLPPPQGVQDNRLFVIYNGIVWFRDAAAPTAGSVTLFNHYPFAYESSVVRSVYSDSDSLTVENTNGLVKITANDFHTGAITKGSYAVSSINGSELNFTPVVTDVVAGPGVSIDRSLDGTAYISTANLVGGLLDATAFNHNGTTLISNGSLQYITFPANRKSQFIMTMPIQGVTAPCTLSVWIMKVGTGSTPLTVSASFIQDPTIDTESTVNVQSYTDELNYEAGMDASSLVYGEVNISGCTVSGNGTLVASVSINTAQGEQIQLLRTGFKLNVINQNTPILMYDGNSITQQLQVGDNDINAGDAVYILGGKLVKCTNLKGSIEDTANKCVGIATADASAGEMLTYIITGTMTLSNVNGAPGQSLYINTDGTLTPVTDVNAFLTTASYLQKVGTVLTGNKIQVNIESAVEGSPE